MVFVLAGLVKMSSNPWTMQLNLCDEWRAEFRIWPTAFHVPSDASNCVQQHDEVRERARGREMGKDRAASSPRVCL